MPSNDPGYSGSGLSGGTIAAIAVAVFIILLIATIIITLCLIKIGENTIFNLTRYASLIIYDLIWQDLVLGKPQQK